MYIHSSWQEREDKHREKLEELRDHEDEKLSTYGVRDRFLMVNTHHIIDEKGTKGAAYFFAVDCRNIDEMYVEEGECYLIMGGGTIHKFPIEYGDDEDTINPMELFIEIAKAKYPYAE